MMRTTRATSTLRTHSRLVQRGEAICMTHRACAAGCLFFSSVHEPASAPGSGRCSGLHARRQGLAVAGHGATCK